VPGPYLTMTMNNDELAKLINTISETTPEVGHALSTLMNRIALQDDRNELQDENIDGMRNDIHMLQKRVLEQERYSSKDCIII
jgi:arsenate reductase-like glutaredoxin family protein